MENQDSISTPIFALAPMVGFTDRPFRRLCQRLGADYLVTEMISSEALCRKNPRTLRMIEEVPEEKHTAVQLMGSNPRIMAEAARILQDLGAREVNINMGCPEKKIVAQGAGAWLMKDPAKALKIAENVKKAVDIPVTVKMRLGWSMDKLTAQKIVLGLQEIGISLVAIHARTRAQMFSGEPDWKAVYPIKQRTKMTVLINGDIKDTVSLRRALKKSGADGVMIGRGALGRPWIFQELKNDLTRTKEIGQEERGPKSSKVQRLFAYKDLIKRHLDEICTFYEDGSAIVPLRLHLNWYSKGLKNSAEFRQKIQRLDSEKALIKAFFKFIDAL